MAQTDAQRRATAKYRREKMKQVVVSFSPAEMDVYGFLKAQPNMSGYLKSLVRAEMARAR